MTLTRSNRETLLKKIHGLVQEKFYDPQFHGKDWGAIVERHREEILASKSSEAFEGEVTAMFGELDSSGLGILGEHSKITPRSAINASFQKINTVQEGERWIFQDVLPGGGVAERAGIRPGDALLSIQGKNATSMEKPAFPIGESSIPILISRKGTQKEAHLDLKAPPKYKDNPYAEPESITASMKGNSTGKVKVGLFPGKNRNRLREARSAGIHE